MQSQPLVSVIVPSFNHEKYVEECLQSVFSQTYRNIQLIVIDDGSTDKSVEIIRRLNVVHPFIFETQQNAGISKTLNKAITCHARGKYIAIIASDDLWHYDKIRLQVEFAEKFPEYGMLSAKAKIINAQSKEIGEFDPVLFKGNFSFNEIAFGKCLIPAVTVLIRKDVFDVVGLFDESLVIEDLDMWLRIADKYTVGFMNEFVAYYRRHGSNVSGRPVEMNRARFRILHKWESLPPAIYNKIRRNMELQALADLSKIYPAEAEKYLNITFKNFLNAAYRKFILRRLFKGQL